MKKVFGILCFFVAALPASDFSDSARTLRISSWPLGAELYLGDRPGSFVRESSCKSPHDFHLERSDSIVRVTLFKPGYSDTTLDIRVTDSPQSFAWIELEEADLEKIEFQEKILDRRKNRHIGKILFASSLLPLSLTGTFTALSTLRFRDADRAREKIENSVIREGEEYRSSKKKFSDAKKGGKNYRTAAGVSLGFSALFLVSAIIFSF